MSVSLPMSKEDSRTFKRSHFRPFFRPFWPLIKSSKPLHLCQPQNPNSIKAFFQLVYEMLGPSSCFTIVFLVYYWKRVTLGSVFPTWVMFLHLLAIFLVFRPARAMYQVKIVWDGVVLDVIVVLKKIHTYILTSTDNDSDTYIDRTNWPAIAQWAKKLGTSCPNGLTG